MNWLHALVGIIAYHNQETTSNTYYPIINHAFQVYPNCYILIKKSNGIINDIIVFEVSTYNNRAYM